MVDILLFDLTFNDLCDKILKNYFFNDLNNFGERKNAEIKHKHTAHPQRKH